MADWIEYETDWGYWINPDTFRVPRIKRSVRVGAVLYTKKRETLDTGRQIIATTYAIAYEDGIRVMDKREVSTILASQMFEYMQSKKMYPPNTKIKKTYANGGVDLDFAPSEYDSFVIRLTPELVGGNVEDFLYALDDFKETSTDDSDGRWKIETAKSGRSSCRTCGDLIPMGHLRLGEPSVYEGHVSYRWHHLKCKAQILDGVDLKKLAGYEELTSEKRNELKQALSK